MKRTRERKPTVAEELAALRVVLERIAVALERYPPTTWTPYYYPETWQPARYPTWEGGTAAPTIPTVTW